MFNLNYILILSLISFTLQDSHCLITDEYCEEEDVGSGKIPHCYDEDGNGKCENCQNGYAISYEGTSCMLSPGCDKLEKGNQNCADCSIGFLTNSNGQCERSLCTGYENW